MGSDGGVRFKRFVDGIVMLEGDRDVVIRTVDAVMQHIQVVRIRARSFVHSFR